MRLDHVTRAPQQVPRLAGSHAMAPPLGLAHHGEGRVLVGSEDFQRIGDEEDVHGGGRIHAPVLLHKKSRFADAP
jgi:hypothetical protein